MHFCGFKAHFLLLMLVVLVDDHLIFLQNHSEQCISSVHVAISIKVYFVNFKSMECTENVEDFFGKRNLRFAMELIQSAIDCEWTLYIVCQWHFSSNYFLLSTLIHISSDPFQWFKTSKLKYTYERR